MQNEAVARIFDELADLLEIDGANPFRVRAYRNAARTIRDLGESLEAMARDPDRKLHDLPGIGKDLADKIQTILETADLPLRQELRRKVAPGLLPLLTIAGLGPKRAAILGKELKVQSVEDLRAACEAHRVRELKGFGEKTEEAILRGLENIEQGSRRVLLSQAKRYADAVVEHLKGERALGKIAVAGSLRRRRETIGDVDVLVTSQHPERVMDRLAAFDDVETVLARGETKMTVRFTIGLQMDLRVVPEESYGAALQYFTGSKAHNIELRRRAIARGLKISEYGVFRGDKMEAGRTEEDVYEAVGLPWIPPELRENRGEIELAEKDALPALVEVGDLRGDLHMHTTATDGKASLEEMVEAAERHGYKYIAITDHSKRVTMAGGLDPDRLRRQWKEIDRLNKKRNGITVLKGVEMDVLEDGSMDLPDDVLAEADWVVASLHYGQNQPPEKITRRLTGAVRNPYVCAIGHPTGRLIGARKGYDFDFDELLRACAETGTMLEINSQPHRLDLDDVMAAAAREHGVMIVIDTDAHSTQSLDFIEFGVYQARRAGLEKRHVANTRTLAQLKKLVKKKRT